jgi:hypothetical protein
MVVTERRMLRQLVSLATRRLLLRVAGVPMKHPVRGDFDTAVTEAGVNVTFKPTNSIYSFYKLAGSDDVARLGPVSLGPVRHAGPRGRRFPPPWSVEETAACLIVRDRGGQENK